MTPKQQQQKQEVVEEASGRTRAMLPPGIFTTCTSTSPLPASAPGSPAAGNVVAAGNYLSTSSPVAVVNSAPQATFSSVPAVSTSACSPQREERRQWQLQQQQKQPAVLRSPSPYKPGEALAKSAVFSAGGEDAERLRLPGVEHGGSAAGTTSATLSSSTMTSGRISSSSQAETEAGSSPCWSDTDNLGGSPLTLSESQSPLVLLRLEELVKPPPAPPSLGSAAHLVGACKPCAFVFKGGCQSGKSCVFCHLCMPGEKQRRKKELKTFKQLTGQIW